MEKRPLSVILSCILVFMLMASPLSGLAQEEIAETNPFTDLSGDERERQEISLGISQSGYGQETGQIAISGRSLPVTTPERPMLGAGQNYSMILDKNGEIRSWGAGSAGQLGIWTSSPKLTPVKPNLPPIKMISAGLMHTLAVKETGELITWGQNSSGQLGNGSIGGSTSSAQTPSGLGAGEINAVSAGRIHSLAVKKDGTVFSWGDNAKGQLGRAGDTAVPGRIEGLNDVIAVAGGYSHSLALTSDGAVWAWGANEKGQLGIGSTVNSEIPVQVQGLTDVKAIAAGYQYSAAVTEDGQVYVWGGNDGNQLGKTGVNEKNLTPGLLAAENMPEVKAVSAINCHTLALTESGDVWSWGGITNTGTGVATPRRVDNLTDIVAVAAGNDHSLALRRDGVLWVWGGNASGQLGDGATTALAKPRVQNTDMLTATRYADNLLQLHLTSPEQVERGYKGGEGWQVITCMDISPSNPDMLVTGTDTNGIWKSEDNGKTWRGSTGNFNAIAAYSVAFDPDDENVIYALGGSSVKNNANGTPYATGIYLSEDGGQSWTLLYKTNIYKRTQPQAIAFGTGEDNHVYVGTQEKGLIRFSRDARDKQEFEQDYSVILQDVGIIRGLNVTGGRVIAATGTNGIMASEDGGASWSERNNGIAATDANILAYSVTVNPVNPDHWFCVANRVIYQTTNSGASWTHLSNQVSAGLPMKVLFSAPREDGAPYLYMEMDGIGTNLRVSGNYGSTWNMPVIHAEQGYVTGNTGYYAEGFTADKHDPEKIWISIGNEIYHSTDGGRNLYPSSSGCSGANVTDIYFDPGDAGDIYIPAIDLGLSRSVPGAKSPQAEYPVFAYVSEGETLKADGKSAHGFVIDPSDPDHMYTAVGGWYTYTIMESLDRGGTWAKVEGVDTKNPIGDVIALRYHKDDAGCIYMGKYRSDDNGLTWNELDYTICAVSPANNDIVYAIKPVTIGNGAYNHLYRSDDRGETWYRVKAGMNSSDDENLFFHDKGRQIIPDVADPDSIWVVRYRTYWGTDTLKGMTPLVKMKIGPRANDVYTASAIRTFDVRDPGAPQYDYGKNATGNTYLCVMAQNPNDPNHIIAGGADYIRYQLPSPGFFESTDGGDTWSLITGMDGTRDVKVIKFHPTKNQVWLGTSAGIWIYEYQASADQSDS